MRRRDEHVQAQTSKVLKNGAFVEVRGNAGQVERVQTLVKAEFLDDVLTAKHAHRRAAQLNGNIPEIASEADALRRNADEVS